MTRALRVRASNTLSWPAFWVALGASVFINLPDRHTTWTADSSWRNLLCSLIAVTAMFSVMLLLRLGLMPAGQALASPWRMVLIFSVGAATRGLAMAALLPTLGGGDAEPVFRVLSSIVIFTPLLAVMAGLVDLIRTSALRRAVLEAEADELVNAERDALARTTELQRGATATVRSLLMERLETLRAGRADHLETQLREDVETVIRPLSHHLFAGDISPHVGPSGVHAARVSWRDVGRSASLGKPFRPVALAWFLAIAL